MKISPARCCGAYSGICFYKEKACGPNSRAAGFLRSVRLTGDGKETLPEDVRWKNSAALFPRGHILELKMIRPVAGLSVFKLNAVSIEGLAGDDGHTVVIVHIQLGFVDLCDMFHSHSPLAGGNGKAKVLLQILIDGMLRNLWRQSRNQLL